MLQIAKKVSGIPAKRKQPREVHRSVSARPVRFEAPEEEGCRLWQESNKQIDPLLWQESNKPAKSVARLRSCTEQSSSNYPEQLSSSNYPEDDSTEERSTEERGTEERGLYSRPVARPGAARCVRPQSATTRRSAPPPVPRSCTTARGTSATSRADAIAARLPADGMAARLLSGRQRGAVQRGRRHCSK